MPAASKQTDKLIPPPLLLEGTGTADEMERLRLLSSPSPTPTSWLKKFFKENKSSYVKANQENVNEAVDAPRDSFMTRSPIISRRRALTTNRSSGKRKTSVGPSSAKSTRKLSTANTHENLLHYTVVESDIDNLVKILESKVEINFMRPPGLSALHQACIIGELNVIELLVSFGADVTLKTWSGLTPLQIATLFGHFDVAQFLIKEGANSQDVQNGINQDEKLISSLLVR